MNDYSLNDKSYVKKSKKVLSKAEEIRSKSGKPVNSRGVSPVYHSNMNMNMNGNMVDTKKYVSIAFIYFIINIDRL